MKYLKYIITSVLLVMVAVSCDHEPNLPIPIDETMANTGTYLRILEVEMPAFDVGDLENAFFAFRGEIFNERQGQGVESVEFWVSYFDVDRENVIEADVLGFSPIKTYPGADIQTSQETGLPTATFSMTLLEILDYFDSQMPEGGAPTLEQIQLADRFDIRWQINLDDGRSFTNVDASPDVQGGFYASPYFARASVVPVLEEDEFTGTYLFEAQNTGVFGWWTFDETFEAELTVDPNNFLNGRVFESEPYAADWGGLAEIEIPIQFMNSAQFAGPGIGIGTGLGCAGGPGLAIGAMQDEDNFVPVDVNDDSQFTLVLADNVRGDCAAPDVDVVFIVTKQ